MLILFENSLLYTAVEIMRKNFLPLKNVTTMLRNMNNSTFNVFRDNIVGSTVNANLEMLERLLKEYKKPEFGIKNTTVAGEVIPIEETVVLTKPFCRLIHFKKKVSSRKMKANHLPKLLIVAPLSGHYATLLRGTVKDTLPFFDVYITDWTSGNMVPIDYGKFDLDDYIYYVMEFIKLLGDNLSVMGVCQPVVPVAAAVALLEDEGHKNVDNMILIGGPIDPREANTKVTDFADKRPMSWFEAQMITRVPMNYPGHMRQVYPGFIQLQGFMAMNMQRHIGKHMELYQHLIMGDGENADTQKKFYDEYLSVLDIPAEFYLQTIKTVYKDFALPQGKMMVGDKNVKPKAIKHCALMAIEGELDDIAGVGQTKAALKLFSSIPESRKLYHLQKGVGHYGVFNGRKFREDIVPAMRDFCYANIRKKKKKN